MKNALRTQLLCLRQSLDSKVRSKKNKAIQALVLEKLIIPWTTLLTYVSQPEEVDTRLLIPSFLKKNKQVCVPAFDFNKQTYFASQLFHFKKELLPGQFGILEPQPQFIRPIALSAIDIMLIPGIGFDRQGHRLGYGKGYFDRLCQETRAIKIGLAYEIQLVTSIPVKPHDIPMDFIITENEIISCKK